MDKNIQLSIIVVSLNTKDKFEKTISSIKNQSLKNYELIVVDGKSSDGTIELIEKYITELRFIHDRVGSGPRNLQC